MAVTTLWKSACAPSLLFAATACGLAVDADRFRFDEATDADRAVTVDPAHVFEGAGGPAGFGPGVAVVVSGRSFTPSATLSSADGRVQCQGTDVGPDGRRLVTRCWIAPFFDLPHGQTATVALGLTDGDLEFSVDLLIDGLDELELAGDVNAASLRPRYSRIVTRAAVNVVGDVGLRLVSTGVIDIQHPISVAAEGATPGPGGEPGGGSGQPGRGGRGGARGEMVEDGCAGGGGGAGARSTGGEGGSMTPGGAAGPERPVRVDQLGGHGGGGGGASGDNSGDNGGGGGGVLWIDGVTVSIDAMLDARGGSGGTPLSFGCGFNGAGSGGGGAGGIVFVRAAILNGQGEIDVSGGRGGWGASQKVGGQGSPGWIRVDAPAVPEALQSTGVWRGPAWTFTGRIVAPQSPLEFTLPVEEPVVLQIDGQVAATDAELRQAGGAWPAPTSAGRHDLCLVLASADDTEENRTCVSIAVLP